MPTYELQALNAGAVKPHVRIVKADTQAQALLWLIKHDGEFHAPGTIHTRQILDIVDLTVPAARPPKAKDAVATIVKAEREANLGLEDDDKVLTLMQVMELTGLKASGVYNHKSKGHFQAAGRGLYTRASVQAWLSGGRKKRDTAAIVARMNEARAAKRAAAKAKPVGDPKPVQQAKEEEEEEGEDMVREDVLAKRLGMSIVDMRTLKNEGNIQGGYGWVDRIGFERYLKTKNN